jgi:tetratricopeptide (TPR) repeat protein
MSRPRLIALLLALVTLVAYLPVVSQGFSIFDDYNYVAGNDVVQNGLTWAGIRWAFTTWDAGNWHPLTWISHMADCQLFGLKPGAHHFINVAFHAANAVLLFVLLLRMTGAMWASAFAAALFAWHPLRVESVAWISERKDVLSTFFALLALLAYMRYMQKRPGIRNEEPGAGAVPTSRFPAFDYLCALVCFALGLLAKPMLVTLPFIMLLLDYWPLGRISKSKSGRPAILLRLTLEKWPFFALSSASCLVTFLAQRHGGLVVSLEKVPLEIRLANMPLAYVKYLLKMIWPENLAVLYPLPGKIPPLAVASASVALVLVTATVWFGHKRRPYGLAGWFWFLGALVPVIGLVQVGGLAMADRYTYIPSIGICLAVAMGARDAMEWFPFSKKAVVTAAGLVLAACLAVTENQLRYWRDDVSLFSHVIDVNGESGYGHLRLGLAFEQKGRNTEAIAEYRTAIKLEPERAETHRNLANLLSNSSQLNEALAEYQSALKINPDYVSAHYNLALLLVKLDRPAEAMKQDLEVLRLDPDFANAHVNLAILLAKNGQYDEAIKHCDEVVRLDPASWFSRYLKGKVLLKKGRAQEAVESLKQALQIAPDNPYVLGYLAQVLASHDDPNIRDGRAAFALIQKAIALSKDDQPILLEVLAMAYAELGRFDEAQKVAQAALDLARNYEMTDYLPVLEQQMQCYKNYKPFRQTFTNTSLKEIPAN